MDSKTKKISISAFVLILIFFLMPFMTVSCEGQTVETFSGFKLATGTSIDSGYGEIEKVNPSFPIIIAILCAVGGIVYLAAVHDAKALIPTIISAVGVVALFIFKSGAASKAAEKGLTSSFKGGFWLTVFAFIVSAGFNGFVHFKGGSIDNILQSLGGITGGSNNSSGGSLPGNRPNIAPPQEARFCTECGASIASDNMFCTECGSKITS